jgi:hypothetical protein
MQTYKGACQSCCIQNGLQWGDAPTKDEWQLAVEKEIKQKAFGALQDKIKHLDAELTIVKHVCGFWKDKAFDCQRLWRANAIYEKELERARGQLLKMAKAVVRNCELCRSLGWGKRPGACENCETHEAEIEAIRIIQILK